MPKLNDIPTIRFILDGRLVLDMPAHLFLVVQGFQGKAAMFPKPDNHITLEVGDTREVRQWHFKMPALKEC